MVMSSESCDHKHVAPFMLLNCITMQTGNAVPHIIQCYSCCCMEGAARLKGLNIAVACVYINVYQLLVWPARPIPFSHSV